MLCEILWESGGMGSKMVACQSFCHTQACVCFRLLLYCSSPARRGMRPSHHQGSLATSVRSYLGLREYSPQICASSYSWFFSFSLSLASMSSAPLLSRSLNKKHVFVTAVCMTLNFYGIQLLPQQHTEDSLYRDQIISRSCLCDFTFCLLKELFSFNLTAMNAA